MAKKPKSPSGRRSSAAEREENSVRIIGGYFRGRVLHYSGDPRTRPMKDRVREALFNLLGTAVAGKLAIDLFAGTGVIGLEALSRGAARAILIERHFPTAEIIWQNVDTLGVRSQVDVIAGDAFLWPRRETRWEALSEHPWLVFCSPPFDFYVDRQTEMLGLLETLRSRAPAGSWFAVEADERFDFNTLATWGDWDIRPYWPAVLGLLEV